MTFIGHLLSSEAVKPDPKQIAAIVNMETPVDVQGVQRLIDMVKYLLKLHTYIHTYIIILLKFKFGRFLLGRFETGHVHRCKTAKPFPLIVPHCGPES